MSSSQDISSSKRPRNDSSSTLEDQALAVTRPASVTQLAKKARNDETEKAHDSAKNINLQNPLTGLRTALDINKATTLSYRLDKLGSCPSVVRRGRKKTKDLYDICEEEIEEEDDDDETIERDEANEQAIDQLAGIIENDVHVSASGHFATPFKLHITRPGCEFDQDINPNEDKDDDVLNKVLKRWYENGAISGYGDIRAQETLVNEDVRRAREINSSEFSVDPELLQQVQDLWDQHFFPNTSVRAEPYKIHIYGPSGHFKTHRDTPQRDLVGTFLLGLGDTAWTGNLLVDGMRVRADPGSWCAFYPDVPHSVEELLCDEYRAVIAFKMFRTEPPNTQVIERYAHAHASVTEAISKLKAPVGIFLERKYCLGTTELSGFDALLLESTRARTDIQVHLLPVVTRYYAAWGNDSQACADEQGPDVYDARVYPFTDADIDYLLDRGEEVPRSWIRKLKPIRFYSADFDRSVVTWSSDERETVNYVGNEAEAWREDSIYMSYAMLVLPSDLDTSM
ncbi:hypothetical protein BV22DRAFT_5670 [Leucogyrophana mollusca]|uniref:Uncharacterized protein n=1 Tax=Leucogyrophana mollusca TaxID=85980 RepID=A0ACB8BYZ8_9AGAM|nr:hypothetical protein BV22DRAFT_5670 [Leucogyrophana mollusca]